MLLEAIAPIIINNLVLFFFIILISCAIWGDGSYIFFVILAYESGINLLWVFTAAYMGSLLGDFIWFFIGLKFIGKRLKKDKNLQIYLYVGEFFERFFKNKDFLAILLTKFLYGTRIITTIYMANKKLRFLRFLLYDLIANLWWVVLIGAIGWLFALGVETAYVLFKNAQIAILLLVILLIGFFYIQKKINKKIKKVIK
jgi:membrane protein DedA with SNARE-associated domain